MNTPAPENSREVYGVFCGSIDADAVRRIFENLVVATNPTANIRKVHLLFQSNGGLVGDGVALYNFFKRFPLDLTLYNAGSIFSIAVIAYLGANNRKTSARASFGIHRSIASPQAASAASLQDLAETLTIDDQRTQSIFRDHLTLSKKQWSVLSNGRDLTFSGEDAIKTGLAHELGEFSPPPGAQLFNV